MSDERVDSMIDIALSDAARNCSRDGAKARITLRGGPQIEGHLEKREIDLTTVHVKTAKGGWATALRAEVVAVETWRP